MTRYAYGTTLADPGVARSDLLRAEIYPDSDDVASPLGNGPDGVYDRFEMKYNRQGEVIERKDPASTIHALDYDKLGRQTHDRVTALGPQINGAVRRISRAYEVRGMLLEVTSWDNATVGAGAIVNQVRLAYNTFGQPVIEYQEHGGAVNTATSPKVQVGTANGAANTIRPISVTYPNGRVAVWDYSTTGSTPDALSRIARIFVDNVQVASYVYLGLGRIVQVDHPQPFIPYDLATGSGSDPYSGLDRFGRVIDCRWRDYGSGTPIDAERVQYGYDRANNRKYRENTVDTTSSKAELYGYDGMYRLKNFERGTLNAAKTALTIKTFAQQWSLDATGNWSGFNEDTHGDGTWELGQTRVSNKVNEIQNFTNSPGPTWFSPSYDAAGNMTIAPVPSLPGPLNFRSQEFDAWNRLTKAVTATAVLGEFAYDGLGRRITKKTFSGGTPLNTRHFYYSQDWQVLEERIDAATVPQRQFVWGIRYIDDLLFRDRDTNADGTLDERLYGIQDNNWNLTAVADTNGDIQERYRYDAYGLPTVLTPAFASSSSSLFDWETLYASYRWNAETKMYQVRNRWLDSRVGVWVTRDPAKYFDGLNIYAYCNTRPISDPDPSGLATGHGSDSSPDKCDQTPRLPRYTPRPRCGPDVTDWLVQSMANNGRRRPGTIFEFRQKVRKNGPWDFKASQSFKTRACPRKCERSVTICGRCFDYDVPGNIHFGFVGTAWNIDDRVLHAGANYAQSGGVDDPQDAQAIDVGIELASKYPRGSWGHLKSLLCTSVNARGERMKLIPHCTQCKDVYP